MPASTPNIVAELFQVPRAVGVMEELSKRVSLQAAL